MMKYGLKVKCERCGKETFFEEQEIITNDVFHTYIDEDKKNSSADYLSSGWKRFERKDLCPECSQKYEMMIDQFFIEYKNDLKMIIPNASTINYHTTDI